MELATDSSTPKKPHPALDILMALCLVGAMFLLNLMLIILAAIFGFFDAYLAMSPILIIAFCWLSIAKLRFSVPGIVFLLLPSIVITYLNILMIGYGMSG